MSFNLLSLLEFWCIGYLPQCLWLCTDHHSEPLSIQEILILDTMICLALKYKKL